MLKIKDDFLAIIPARKGSKRIKNKNRLIVKGKKLIEHSLDAAIKSKFINDIVVSSDDQKILNLSKKYKEITFLKRKKYLSTDNATTTAVIYDLIKNYPNLKKKYIILLQPTSPLREVKHIDDAIKKFINRRNAYDSLVSVCKVEEPHPYKMKKIINGKLISFIRGKSSEKSRQELPNAYFLNGAIYIIETNVFIRKKSFFSKTMPYIMSNKYSINLDTPLDLEYLNIIK